MEQNKKIEVWKIVLISLAIAAVVAVGVIIIIKIVKKTNNVNILGSLKFHTGKNYDIFILSILNCRSTIA
jgi:hypothetical protein